MSDTTGASPAQTPAPQGPVSGQAGTHSDAVKNATSEVLSNVKNDAKPAETDDVDDTGEDLPSEEEVTKMTAAEKKAWKLKVGGKDVEVNEEELLKRAQMGYSADEKWQEAAKMRKQMENFIGLLQEDPAAALEKMGFNVDEMAEKRIQQRIEEMKKSPEQVEKEKIEKELKSLKDERERERQQQRDSELKNIQDKYAIELETEISQAFDNTELGLPKSPYIIKRMADVLIQDVKMNKKQTLSAKKALEIVQDEVREELNNMYSLAPDEVFEKLVGKDRLNKYRKGKIKKSKSTPNSDVKPTGTTQLQKAQEAQKPKTKENMKDFFRKLGTK